MLLAVATACLLCVGCAHHTTVVLVRHAEKGAGQDPDLTPQGQARAEALVEIARRERVEAIFVTPFKRTAQTAAPTAEALGLMPIVVPLSASVQEHVSLVASRIRAEWKNKGVLVVGHSNTVPLIMTELGAQNVRPIGENEFGQVFIVKFREGSATTVEEGRFGD
jgi:broad specificity phosphatase PhoE